MKVAIVCDWLTSVGGAERVLKSISELFPDAPIYTSQYNQKKIDWFKDRDVRVGWLQIFPTSFRKALGPLRQAYFNHLDLSDYELIISVTGAEAKSVKKGNALHLCYCHVPTQYYWGLRDDYMKNPGFGILNPLARLGLKLFLKPLKKADYEAAQKPDYYMTISTYAQEQIKKSYGRESTIIFPPVAVEKFSTSEFSTSNKTIKNNKSQEQKTEQKPKERYGFVVTSRQVNWKRLDLAVEACEALHLPLTVIGEGPEHKKLVKLAKKSRFIKFLPLMNQSGLKSHLEKAEGYIFPSLEPFGIAPVEALACGCPVIAYGNGGALDYVIDGENGILFGKQNVNSLRQAIKRFKTLKFNEEKIRKTSLPFSEAHFQNKIKSFIVEKVKEKKGMETTKSQVYNPEPISLPDKQKPSKKTTSPAPIYKPKQNKTFVKRNKTTKQKNIKPAKNIDFRPATQKPSAPKTTPKPPTTLTIQAPSAQKSPTNNTTSISISTTAPPEPNPTTPQLPTPEPPEDSQSITVTVSKTEEIKKEEKDEGTKISVSFK